MSFEDDMIDAGYSDEEEYLDYLLSKEDSRQSYTKIYQDEDDELWELYGDDVEGCIKAIEDRELKKFSYYIDFVKDNPIYPEAIQLIKEESAKFLQIKNKFKDLFPNCNYFMKIKNGEGTLYGYVGDNNEVIFSCKYNKIELIEQGIALVKEGNLYYCINLKGEKITPYINRRIEWVDARYSIYSLYGNYAIIDLDPDNNYRKITSRKEKDSRTTRDTKTIISPKGLMAGLESNSWQLINPQYDYVCRFLGSSQSHLIAVQKNKKWGFISGFSCEEVIPCIYDDFVYCMDLANYCHGLYKEIFFYQKFFDWTSEELLDFLREHIGQRQHIKDKYCLILKYGGKYGIVDTLGNIVVDFKYDYLGYGKWKFLGYVLWAKNKEDENPYVIDIYGNEIRIESFLLKCINVKIGNT